MNPSAYSGAMLDDDVLVLAGKTPNALFLLSEAEDKRDWTPDLLAFLPPSLSNSPYTQLLWSSLVWAVGDVQANPQAVHREAEQFAGRVREVLGTLVTGAPVCPRCAEDMRIPFERLVESSVCRFPSHSRASHLRAVA